jgi:hypothetical protein
MAQRVVLHVGLMKSGTTYLQRRLEANRDLLAGSGVLFPGRTWNDQVAGVVDILQRRRVGPPTTGAWARLVDEAAVHDGTVVLSMEFLAPAAPTKVHTVVESFGEAQVDVVMTLRDLGRGVPAMWQESLQNGGVQSWRQYVDSLRGDTKPSQVFWRKQGMGRIAAKWAAIVGPERLSLVTVPRPGAEPGLLWARFCEAAGIDGSTCLEVSPANTSLDAASALVLRDLNLRLQADELSPGDYHTLVKFGLGKGAMAGRGAGPAIGFDPPPWLRRRAERMTAKLAVTGARVVGDLAELAPVTVAGVDPETVDAEARLEAAVDALRALTLRRAEERRVARQATTTSEIS